MTKDGEKTGGRVKGTLNKSSVEIQARLKELGCNPIEGLAKLAVSTENEDIKFKCYKELAQYVAPKLRAIELKTENSNNIGIAERMKRAEKRLKESNNKHG